MSEPEKSKMMQRFEASADKLVPQIKLLNQIASQIERIKKIEIDPINDLIDQFGMSRLKIDVSQSKDRIEISFPHHSDRNMPDRSFEIEVTDNCDVLVFWHYDHDHLSRSQGDYPQETPPFEIDKLRRMVVTFLNNNISPDLEEKIVQHMAEEKLKAEQNGTDGQALGQDEPA